ncbi:MAG TPA: ion transporter [Gallionellaceae bacterium]|nr:ion transporter [Gallionellaceae bacterium]
MSKAPPLKQRLYNMLQGLHAIEPWASLFNISLASLIILNVLAMMLETMDELYLAWRVYFLAFELFSVALFMVEYLLRVWSATLNPKYKHPLGGRLRYMLSPMALFDLAAFLPSLLLLGGLDLRFLRMLRLFRVVRLLHIPRYNLALHSIWQAASSKKAEFLIAGTIMFVLLIICSSLAYFAEHDAQPKAFSSIPASMWWGIMTMTTVGYGDVYPITTIGKFIAAFFAALGIGFFALPSAILASALIEQSREREMNKTCPHCGGELKQ